MSAQLASRPSVRFGFKSALAAALFAGVTLAPSDAEASGYLTARFGADHGTPAQPNAFAIYFNPAALGGTEGTTITGDVSVLLRFVRYNRTAEALSPSNDAFLADQSYIDANTGVANLTNLLALPFFGVTSDFGTKNFRAGYAAYVPFGGLATWTRRDGVPGVPGSVDGVQRWHNISGQILAIYNTFAAAYRFGKVSVGLSVSPIIHNVVTVRARNPDGSDDTIANGQLVEGRSLLDATGFNLSASAGVYYEPTETLRFGLSYLAQPGFYNGGETRLSGTLQTKLGSNPVTKQDIDFLQNYPDIIRFGADVKATERLVLRGDFEFVRWNVFERQCVVNPGADCNVADDGRDLSGGQVILNVPRRWNNAIGLRVGPGYMLNEKTEVFGSLGLTTSAVPVETIDASTIDSTRLYGTAGAKFALTEKLALAASYNHIFFFPINTDGRNDQNIAAHPASSPGGGDYNASRSPSADGNYRSQIGFVNVNVAYTF